MKVLVAESVAQEGLERLRAHHEVDERIGLGRDMHRSYSGGVERSSGWAA